MAVSKKQVFQVDSADMKGVKAAFRRLDKEGSKILRAEVQKVADRHAGALRSAAGGFWDRRVGGLAGSIRAAKDRMPVINVGGAKRAGVSGGATAGDLVFGTEFGSNDWRFPTWNADGYWLFPALRARQRALVGEWEKAVDDVVKLWGKD